MVNSPIGNIIAQRQMTLGLSDEVLMGFECTIIVLLDLNATFDKLLEVLNVESGILGVALQQFESFLRERTQKVRIDGQLSSILEIMFGTVQGSLQVQHYSASIYTSNLRYLNNGYSKPRLLRSRISQNTDKEHLHMQDHDFRMLFRQRQDQRRRSKVSTDR